LSVLPDRRNLTSKVSKLPAKYSITQKTSPSIFAVLIIPSRIFKDPSLIGFVEIKNSSVLDKNSFFYNFYRSNSIPLNLQFVIGRQYKKLIKVGI